LGRDHIFSPTCDFLRAAHRCALTIAREAAPTGGPALSAARHTPCTTLLRRSVGPTARLSRTLALILSLVHGPGVSALHSNKQAAVRGRRGDLLGRVVATTAAASTRRQLGETSSCRALKWRTSPPFQTWLRPMVKTHVTPQTEG
jgi:hypothetical protein